MAINIRQPTFTYLPGYGQEEQSATGNFLGGVGTGLKDLLEHKIGEMNERKQYELMQQRARADEARQQEQLEQGLSQILGPEQAKAFRGLPKEILAPLVKQKLAEPSQQAYAASLQQLLGGPAMAPTEQVAGAPQVGPVPPLAGLTESQAGKLAPLVLQKQEAARKEAQKERHFTQQQKNEAFKMTAPVRKEVLEASKGAKETQARLDRMEKLNKEGDLRNPALYTVANKFGLDIPALTSPSSQEFEKLTVDFLKSARTIFGSRITNFDASTFLKSVPSLSQTTAGRERVINNLKLMNEAAVDRQKAMQDIIKENNGTPPLDLAEKIEEKVGPKLDSLYEKFATQPTGKTLYTGEKLPDASKYTGKIARNPATGQRMQSDGKTWKAI